MSQKTRKTTVGNVSRATLTYTAGKDIELDLSLVEADCIGSAAHAIMLSEMPVRPRIFTASDLNRVIAELVRIMRRARRGSFVITLEDQDVHLALERELTRRLGNAGKKIHTGRSRNDQVATALRLYGKEHLLQAMRETLDLCAVLADFAERQRDLPMVGRTHMQPAMPSSVGLWAAAYAENLLDDLHLLRGAYEINDQCPLGSAAGYGVPLPIDRRRVSALLGFRRPQHNVLAAGNARGKMEAIILAAMSQAMVSLSRLAQDLILFTMPEFNYFTLPPEMCTGSSIMPQKRNPDVLELLRARTARVAAAAAGALEIVRALPSGYNRDLQEIKGLFLEGVAITHSSLRVMQPLIAGLRVNRAALLAGFSPQVFAADRALELVGRGMPFRDAYHLVKEQLGALRGADPRAALARKKHLGGPAGLDFRWLKGCIAAGMKAVAKERRDYYRAVSRLLKIDYQGSGE